VKFKRIITFTKRSRKKLKIKTMRAKFKNIITSIWIQWWNWKQIELLQKKTQGKELEIKTIRTKLKNIVFSKLWLKIKTVNE
jgi:hypothetical protein